MDSLRELELLRESWTETFDQLFVLHEMLREAAAGADPDGLLDFVLTQAVLLLGAEGGRLSVANPAGGLRVKCVKGSAAAVSAPGSEIPAGCGLAGEVARSGKPVILNGTIDDPRLKQDPFLSAAGATGIVCVPVILRGAVAGTLEVIGKKKDAFTVRDRDFLSAAATVAALAVGAPPSGAVPAALQKPGPVEKIHFPSNILEALPDAFLMIDVSGTIVYANIAALKLLNVTTEGAVGNPCTRALSQEQELLEHIRVALLEGETRHAVALQLRGTGKHLFLSTALIHDGDGTMTGVGVILQDVVLGTKQTA